MNTTWISSMAELSPIVMPVLEMLNPQRICEIGAGTGMNSKVLGEFLRKRQGQLFTIDPTPLQGFMEWAAVSCDVVTHIHEYSLKALPLIGKADAWFLDGDHNWYTVYHELLCLEKLSEVSQDPLLIFLHDMSWPCARRDLYYDPKQIPAEFLHPHSSEITITLDNPSICEGGLGGSIWAMHEGGPRNGILTAVEDFIAQSKIKFHWIHVPAVLGLGVLVDQRHPLANQIVQFYAPYHNHPLLAALERDRVSKHLTICVLQDKISKMSTFLKSLNKFCDLEKI